VSKIDVANPTSSLEALVDADLDTLATALYVTTDDLLKQSPQLAPYRVECGRSRETAKRSELAGWAEYGYCASHSRYFWGLRLHLVCTLQGLPVAFALADAKADEREVLAGMFTADPELVATRPGQTLIGDKNYFGAGFEATMAGARIKLLRPARKGEPQREGAQFFKPLRQIIESINDTFKGQLDLEQHGGRTPDGQPVKRAPGL
jgi:hypothetical protein